MTVTIDYPFGSVKQDPVTEAVAVRRDAPIDDPAAWAVMDPRTGGSYAPTAHVVDWEDRT